MTPLDLNDLKLAKERLENPSLAAKVTNLIGKPLEAGLQALPAKLNASLATITRTALTTSMSSALFTLKHQPGASKSNRLHKLAVAASGGVGGAFGFAALAVELPFSTTIMLRSIADVARSEGETIHDIESKLACMEVFALGSTKNRDDDAVESGYFAIRASLANSVAASAKEIAKNGLTANASPALVRMINAIAQRFSIQITEKMAAQAIPAIGAAGGALINTIFIDHFQEMAHGHFTVRRLERKYGADAVRNTYEGL
jgi:hypothetical protein